MNSQWIKDWPDPERTTEELMLTLDDDVKRLHEMLVDLIDTSPRDEDGNVDADYGFYARQLIRAIFAYVEAVTFSVKVTAAKHCLDSGIELSDGERHLSIDTSFRLEKDGQVKQSPARVELSSNIKFMFSLLERANASPRHFDLQSEWWRYLKESIKVRNRLVHPIVPNDIDVSGDEIVSALKGLEGFTNTILEYRS